MNNIKRLLLHLLYSIYNVIFYIILIENLYIISKNLVTVDRNTKIVEDIIKYPLIVKLFIFIIIILYLLGIKFINFTKKEFKKYSGINYTDENDLFFKITIYILISFYIAFKININLKLLTTLFILLTLYMNIIFSMNNLKYLTNLINKEKHN